MKENTPVETEELLESATGNKSVMEQIDEALLQGLEESDAFPEEVVQALKHLHDNGGFTDKQKVIEVLKMKVEEDSNEDS